MDSRVRSLLLIVFAASLAACSARGPTGAASLVAELDAKIPAVVARGNSPSIQVAVVHDGEIAWSRAYGENTSTGHIYMNASVQKVFTAVAVLRLAERGLVDLDADVQDYVPFPVRHPDYPEKPVTVRMLLAHRSGLDSFPHQFDWDTRSVFAPNYRPPCPDRLLPLSPEEFLAASLEPDGANYDRRAWVFEPGRGYRYSVSAYPLLRYLVGRVSGEDYPRYMRENVFVPLGMTRSGFRLEEFVDRHAVPYTRSGDENIELPLWPASGWLMRTTAEDMAKFMIALMNDGRYGNHELLRPETVELMRRRTTRFKYLFRSGDDLPSTGRGLGLHLLRGGWLGTGGSAPGFQSLWRFRPSRRTGYVIMSNVNAILVGGENYRTARSEIYGVQNALVSILDPSYAVRRWAPEFGILAALLAGALVLFSVGRRKRAASPPEP